MSCQELGVVVAVDRGGYSVEPKEQPGCSSCRHKKSCLLGIEGRSRLVYCSSSKSYSVGDTVSFVLHTSFFFSSVILYLVPALFSVAGAIFGAYAVTIFKDGDLNALVGFLLALILAFLFIFFINRFRKERDFAGSIVECDASS